jgi:hypothetical protein
LTDLLERAQDGRNVDTRVATLSGEGAGQEVRSIEGANPVLSFPLPVIPALPPGAPQAREASPTYYQRPVFKGPVWNWKVPT